MPVGKYEASKGWTRDLKQGDNILVVWSTNIGGFYNLVVNRAKRGVVDRVTKTLVVVATEGADDQIRFVRAAEDDTYREGDIKSHDRYKGYSIVPLTDHNLIVMSDEAMTEAGYRRAAKIEMDLAEIGKRIRTKHILSMPDELRSDLESVIARVKAHTTRSASR